MARRWQGTSLLWISIDVVGRVERIEVLESSGHAVLDAAAVQAIRRWRFTPGLRDGRPTPFSLRLPVTFRS